MQKTSPLKLKLEFLVNLQSRKVSDFSSANRKQNPTSQREIGFLNSIHKPSVEIQLKGLNINDNPYYP